MAEKNSTVLFQFRFNCANSFTFLLRQALYKLSLMIEHDTDTGLQRRYLLKSIIFIRQLILDKRLEMSE